MSLISAFSTWTRLRIASLPFSSIYTAYPSFAHFAQLELMTLDICTRMARVMTA
jgi:hypothetical protein